MCHTWHYLGNIWLILVNTRANTWTTTRLGISYFPLVSCIASLIFSLFPKYKLISDSIPPITVPEAIREVYPPMLQPLFLMPHTVIPLCGPVSSFLTPFAFLTSPIAIPLPSSPLLSLGPPLS